MKIFFERSGGFAGLIMEANLDLDKMPADDAASLHKLIDAADVFHLDEPVETPGYADGFHYSLRIEKDNDQRSFEFTEGYIPAELIPLVNELSSRAHYQRRGS